MNYRTIMSNKIIELLIIRRMSIPNAEKEIHKGIFIIAK